MILTSADRPAGQLKNRLRKYGFEVWENLDTELDLEKISLRKPELIIVNTFEDDCHTIKIIESLKGCSETKEITVLALLFDYTPEGREALLLSGIHDYLLHPFLEKELLFKVKQLLNGVQRQKELEACKNALEESLQVVQKQKTELEKNLSMAASIQESLIPKTLGNIPNCSFVWHFQPSGRVGGDIFDVFMLDEDHVALYVIDVMGHGLASSMMAVALSETMILDVDRGSPLKKKINEAPYYEIAGPREVIHYLNKRFPFEKYGHYFTIVYLILNVKTGVLRYVRAGHPSPLLIKSDGQLLELDGYGTPIGFELGEDYEEKTVYLDSGDAIIAYTDGVLELRDGQNKFIEYDGFIKLLQKEIQFNNHHYTLALKKLSRSQTGLKDDLSFLEMKWVKFV